MNSIDRRASVLHAFGKQRRIKRAVARLGLAGHELLRDLQIKIDMGKASRVGAALLDLADDVEVIAREAAAKRPHLVLRTATTSSSAPRSNIWLTASKGLM